MSVAASAALRALLAQAGSVRASVVGDLVLDEWLIGTCAAVSREAPVPRLQIERRLLQPGAAANVAGTLAGLGASVAVHGLVGDDDAGRSLVEVLQTSGIATDSVATVPGRRTTRKSRLLAAGQVLARFDDIDPDVSSQPGATARPATRVPLVVGRADVVVLADYGLGLRASAGLEDWVRRLDGRVPVVLDAHELAPWTGAGITVAVPSWLEVVPLLPSRVREVAGPDRVDVLGRHGPQVRAGLGLEALLVTVDEDGAVLLERDVPPRHLAATRIRPAHPAGAGDAVTASVALALGAGAGLPAGAALGMHAAAVVVRQPGTGICRASDVLEAVGTPVVDLDVAAARVTAARAAGRTVAFTNGCFDLLHPGHVRVLTEAARVADVVVVGVNDDASVRRLKGPGRPVRPLVDRATVLAGLSGVDMVVAFGGDAPLSVLARLRPDVFVKGADHDVDALPEAALVRRYGGRVHVVPLLDAHSTSGVIEACHQTSAALAVGAGR
jgi:rfaE bifunctional protein nucleotidyltransferase chain/domain/rfaE bifunctional protein kinase chain/domain